MEDRLPKYPIYIPSKGRSSLDITSKCLRRDGVPFKFVVEPQEHDAYAAKFGEECVLTLPEDNQGLVYSRNWIRDYSTARGEVRHWQWDDNIRVVRRWVQRRRIPMDAGRAIRLIEDFTDRYTNIGLAGMNYVKFCPYPLFPLVVNAHVYSNTLFLNSLPYRFRPPCNEDVDMCLQVLAGGWCIFQFNAFLAEKMTTMSCKGGQTDEAYQGDGRLKMARHLERMWPGVTKTKRRYRKPQHVIVGAWKKFDTKPILRDDIDLDALPKINEFGMELKLVRPLRKPDIESWPKRA